MPLVTLVGGQAPVTPPVVTPDPHNTENPPRKRIIWTGPGGDEFVLTDENTGMGSLKGRSGFGLAPTTLTADDLDSGGALLRSIHPGPQVPHIPLAVWADDSTTFYQRYDTLAASFQHVRGGKKIPGLLTVQRPDGQARHTTAYYQDGLNPQEWTSRKGVTITDLQFWCPSPYWYGAPVTYRVTYPDAAGFPFFPLLPLRLAPANISTGGAVTITNPGDAPSWPVWQITGPGTPTLTSITRGQTISFTSAVPAGRTVTIDTRPPSLAPDTALTAVDDTGANWWPMLDQFPELWPLEAGANSVDLAMAGATLDTQILMSLDPAYGTAW